MPIQEYARRVILEVSFQRSQQPCCFKEVNVTDVGPVFQAFVAPAIFVSAASLLVLSLNVRLMGMVTRLRQFQRERHLAEIADRPQEAQALADQMESIDHRAEKIRKAVLLMLLSLAGTIMSCLLLGLGLYWVIARVLAVGVFVGAIVAMLVGTLYYLVEIMEALSSVRDEAKYFHLMDLGRHSGSHEGEPRERRGDWQRIG